MIGEAQVEVQVAVEVRRATVADFDALLRMYVEFEPKAAALGLPPRQPQRWLESLSVYPNFIALSGERVVGHVVLCLCLDGAEVAVFIHQDSRGQGIARRLLQAAIEEGKRLGLRRVWGTTEYDNLPMLRLVHSLGFVRGEDPRDFHLDLSAPDSAEPAKVFTF